MRRRDRRHGRSNGASEVLLEFVTQGNYVRVSAIDPVTGTEVTTVGSVKATEAFLTRIAVAKLRWVLDKRAAAEVRRRSRRPGREI